jgi:MFS family permease
MDGEWLRAGDWRTGFMLRQLFTVLADGGFRRVGASTLLSASADSMLPAGVAFAVIDDHGSVSEIGLVLGASTFSQLACTSVAGVWADRVPRWLVIVVSKVAQAAGVAAIAALLLLHSRSSWELAAVAGLYGAASAFVLSALTGLVAESVQDGSPA